MWYLHKGEIMNKQKIKLISINTGILGAICGLVAVIPFMPLQIISWIMMSVFSSVIVIYYMNRRKEIGELTIKGGAILGAYIGFLSLIAFLIVFLPINALLGAIFNKITDLFAFSKFLLGIWWILIFMGGIVTALFNAFSLIAYTYIRDTLFMIVGKKEIQGNFTYKDKNNGF